LAKLHQSFIDHGLLSIERRLSSVNGIPESINMGIAD
jgi:hypothetical protein